MYLNRVHWLPRQRAEASFTTTGKAVTSLSLATKTSWIKGDERQERTEWHSIQAWGKLGVYAAGFKKGAHIRVEGELRSREYEANGMKVRTYEITPLRSRTCALANAQPLKTPNPSRRPPPRMTILRADRQN